MKERIDPRVEIGVALMLIVIASLALYGTIGIPPGRFEPLGSGPVPRWTAGLIILLAIWVMVRACLDRGPIATTSGDRWLDAGATFALTLLYVATVHWRLASFAVLTTVYLVVTIGFLTRFAWRTLPAVLILALIIAFGCQYIFTRIFYIDLPGS